MNNQITRHNPFHTSTSQYTNHNSAPIVRDATLSHATGMAFCAFAQTRTHPLTVINATSAQSDHFGIVRFPWIPGTSDHSMAETDALVRFPSISTSIQSPKPDVLAYRIRKTTEDPAIAPATQHQDRICDNAPTRKRQLEEERSDLATEGGESECEFGFLRYAIRTNDVSLFQ